MRINQISIVVFLLFSLNNYAQNYTISGFISDETSGEKLIGAPVYNQKTHKGTSANEYGFYSLTLPQDSIILVVSYMGFKSKKFEIYLDQDIKLNVSLNGTVDIDEVEIIGKRVDNIEERSEMSTVDLQMKKIKELPVLLGEQDVLKTIQLLPGVQSGGEGTSGLYVRGGGPDQNLILLDGVPIYNASHLFGFFSVFNADAINSVKLIKGGFPAHYGGRLSSVIDIRMKEGNNKKIKGQGSLGLISSKLTLEGPITKKTSFIVSGRRTYIDLVARPFIKASNKRNEINNETKGGYYFYDVNAKVNHIFSDRSRLYLSGYFGKDRFYVTDKTSFTNEGVTFTSENENELDWGNAIGALRWNYVITPKLFSNTTITYSKYGFNIGNKLRTENGDDTQIEQFKYYSKIEDYAGKIDLDYSPNPNHLVKFGTGVIHHTFTPSTFNIVIEGNSEKIDSTIGDPKIMGYEMRSYIEDDFDVSERIKVNVGLHFSSFFVEGVSYHALEPRFSGRIKINEHLAAKASYAEMTQYLHLLSNSGIGLPTDLWLPPTKKIKPQKSRQVAVGFAQTFNKVFEISLEGYYKTMDNLIEYKDGASFFDDDINSDWQDKVTAGKGTSYGAEFLLEKKTGSLTGWIGYTLSKSDRQFDEINFGEKYPYQYDRRNDIGIALSYHFNDHVDVGVVWVYGTGNATTLGLERYNSFSSIFGENLESGNPFEDYDQNSEIEHIENRNNYRMPSYHRLDLGINFHKKTKFGSRTWSFGIYNAYNRQNPFFLNFTYDEQGNRRLQQNSLFPLLPSFSYQFEF